MLFQNHFVPFILNNWLNLIYSRFEAANSYEVTIMARVTVEDCLENVKNRFELVMIASKRAREIAVQGAQPLVEWENDKPTVVALREIADGLLEKDYLEKE